MKSTSEWGPADYMVVGLIAPFFVFGIFVILAWIYSIVFG